MDLSLSDLLVVGQPVEELADVADAAQRRGVQVGQDLEQDLRRQPEDQEHTLLSLIYVKVGEIRRRHIYCWTVLNNSTGQQLKLSLRLQKPFGGPQPQLGAICPDRLGGEDKNNSSFLHSSINKSSKVKLKANISP